MLRSFQNLSQQPDTPIKRQAANARDAVAWLKEAQLKVTDAQAPTISAGTRMDAAWDAVLMASLAVACAQGWRVGSEKGHHAFALEGAAQAMGLSQKRFDGLDTLREWRNRKYGAGYRLEPEELEEALGMVKPFMATVAAWFGKHHPGLLKSGLANDPGP